MKLKLNLSLTLLVQILIFQTGFCQNISQWRGKSRTGIYNEGELLEKWPEGGPYLKWECNEIGSGWGSPSIYSNMVYVIGKIDNSEYCTAIGTDGKLRWQSYIGQSWDGSYSDARSTPTVIDNKVYVISGKGLITCLDAFSGKTIWNLDAYKKFEGQCTMWGVCESPIITRDKLIYTPGGNKTTMVALNRNTGETLWQSRSLADSTAYVSPILVAHGGKEIIATISANYFFGTDANDGNILWNYKYSDLRWNQNHPYMPLINCNTPLFHEGEFFISKGYDHLGAQFRLNEDGTGIQLTRTDSVLDVHIGGMVLYEGHIYASNWTNSRDGNWCCINWSTGEKMYETHWESKGSIILADSMLYCYDERNGNIALVKPDPKKFEVVSSFRITAGTGEYWAHPVISNGTLYIRRGKALMAYDIAEINTIYPDVSK